MPNLTDIINNRTNQVTLEGTRTNWVDNSVCSVSNNNGGTTDFAEFQVSKDANNIYHIEGTVTISGASSSTEHTITLGLGGVTFASGGQKAGTQAGQTSGRVLMGAGTALVSITTTVAGGSPRVYFKGRLSGQPSWFDDNLQTASGIPVATADTYGVVKANKIQTKSITSNDTNPGAKNLITFNGLTVGNLYKMEVVVGTQLSNAGSQINYTIDQNDISTGKQPFHDHYNGEGTLIIRSTSFSLTFVADATTVNFASLASTATATVTGETGGKMRTYATLIEYGTTHVATTDWT